MAVYESTVRTRLPVGFIYLSNEIVKVAIFEVNLQV